MAASALDALLDPLTGCLDAESAARVAALQIAAPVQEHIASLAERANEGSLSAREREEYEALVNAADLIALLKLKARRRLESSVQ